MQNKRALLWVVLDTHFREMIRVARALKAHSAYHPVIVFLHRYPVLDRDLEICKKEGIEFEDHTPTQSQPAVALRNDCRLDSPAPKPHWIKRTTLWRWVQSRHRLKAVLTWPYHCALRVYHSVKNNYLRTKHALLNVKYRFVNLFLRVLANYHYCCDELTLARNILDRVKPSVLIFPEDNVGYSTGIFIKAGHELDIPSVVIPYTIANAREPAEAYFDDPGFQCTHWSNRLLAMLFPHWRLHYRGKEMVRLPAPYILARELLRTAPPKPWILNSGYADVIALESEALREYYLKEGLPSRQLQVIGSMRQDELAHYVHRAPTERAKVLAQLGLEDKGKLIVCAVPPNQHPETRPGCEFKTYTALIEFWLKTLGSLQDCNVLLALHPRTGPESIAHLLRPGVTVAQGDIARLIAVSDIFVASVSATICMAIACGKPVVNYDVYKYRYTDYLDVPGVMNMEDSDTFRHTLEQLTSNPHYFTRMYNLQQKCAARWGVLDANAFPRLIHTLDQLASRSAHPYELQARAA